MPSKTEKYLILARYFWQHNMLLNMYVFQWMQSEQ